jgi:hypothetical protein
MTPLRRFFAASFVLVALTGGPAIGRSQQAEKDGALQVYYCQNLAILTVRVFPKRVEVVTASRKATLTETAQPSAAQYSDGSVTLSGLGEIIRVEEPGAVSWCRSAPVEIPWQEARLRGIDFRAAGDPAWSLEIDSGVAVEFATGVGAARTVTTFPPVEVGKHLAWSTKSGSHVLAVVAEQRVCHHQGSTMTLSVTLTLDGKTYTGCGRRLTGDSPDSR